MLSLSVFNAPISVTSKVLTMLPEIENIQKVYSLDIHRIYTGRGVYIRCLRIYVYRILKFVMRYEPTKEKSRCFIERVLYSLDGSKYSY